MKAKIALEIIKRVPQGSVSRAWGWLARQSRPRTAVEALKRAFVAAAGVDMSEASQPLATYRTLEDLFVRELKPGSRPVVEDDAAVATPVDGLVGTCGTVESGSLFQVKGKAYQLGELLGDTEAAAAFEGGPYATIYLSPKDYHRIHAPVRGEIGEAMVIPGALLPVFPAAVESVAELFPRNERLVTYVDSPEAGRLAIVKVGATMVGRIRAAYDPGVHTNLPGGLQRRLRYEPAKKVKKGDLLGAFELGSTVVIVGQANCVDLHCLSPGQAVKMGQRAGAILRAPLDATL